MTKTDELKAARKVVNTFKFGTPEWEAAMIIVRRLVDEVNAARPAFKHTSIDD